MDAFLLIAPSVIFCIICNLDKQYSIIIFSLWLSVMSGGKKKNNFGLKRKGHYWINVFKSNEEISALNYLLFSSYGMWKLSINPLIYKNIH